MIFTRVASALTQHFICNVLYSQLYSIKFVLRLYKDMPRICSVYSIRFGINDWSEKYSSGEIENLCSTIKIHKTPSTRIFKSNCCFRALHTNVLSLRIFIHVISQPDLSQNTFNLARTRATFSPRVARDFVRTITHATYLRACTFSGDRIVPFSMACLDRENRFSFCFCKARGSVARVAYVGRSKWKERNRWPMGR